ncbi:glucose-6-phosphate 1-dehydrogenase-like isoform X2 [Bolinopsis microptera]|uniref:glucose-6-phosphate 1-dehydrogenase-like isoform X2 n=1 Tax=Bolinopsis microptera TaxID=2820187 RepID=UPI00307A0D74
MEALEAIQNGAASKPIFSKDSCVVFTVLGASGDLAKKKIFPSLCNLFEKKILPPTCQIIGYARSSLTTKQLADKSNPFMKAKNKDVLSSFWSHVSYVSGTYDTPDGFIKLNEKIEELEKAHGSEKRFRLFYLALPPSVFIPVCTQLKHNCWLASNNSECRVIVEKPFGRDLDTSNELSQAITALFNEMEIYRIDHYLGKEMVLNLMILRFGNELFRSVWNRERIACVVITFKEPFGTYGRGGYFDTNGIVRDVMQNHLLQILCLVAMERPVSVDASDIRDEKVKVLKFIKPLDLDDVVLGQYVGNPDGKTEDSKLGYRDDPGVPNDSKTATYACAKLQIDNDRWAGVPFIMKCGKAMNERKAEIRIQFRDTPSDIFGGNCQRNELVIRVQPNEAVYCKMNVKSPGMTFAAEESELNLTYHERFEDIDLPDAYERLILDFILGTQTNFVRTDELAEAWRIFTPLLHKLDAGAKCPVDYPYGSRGVAAADEFIRASGFKFSGTYKWKAEKK